MKSYLRKMKGYLMRKEGLYIGAVLLVYITYEYLSEKAAICVGLAVLLFGFLILGQFLFDIARELGNEIETLKYNEFQTLIKMDAIHDKIDGIQGTLDDMRYAEQPLNDKIDAIKTLLDKTLKDQIDTIYELIPVIDKTVYEIRDEQYKSDGLKHYIYLIYETLLPTADTNWLKDKIDAIQGTLNVMRGATGDAAGADAGGQDASIGPAPSTGA